MPRQLKIKAAISKIKVNCMKLILNESIRSPKAIQHAKPTEGELVTVIKPTIR
ncbi:hypothetical protein OAH07_02410 [Verrucomicrobia bacterium]|nr:hypothetical protein [Verrucomicrobiota bacterium]MDC0266366.1 hypothetical protein [bacterium]